MSEDNAPVSGGDAELGIVHVPTSDTSALSPHEAARQLTDFRWKREAELTKKPKQAEAPTQAAAPEPETPPQEADAAPAEEATGIEEATEATPEPAEDLPPIEAPRSWTKEQKAQFASFPREAQEVIAAREQDRETHLRRGQNELAEQRKAMEAERQQVEQARTQYENALPQLLQTLHQQQQGEFSDIRTMADVEKLAREDWPRYALWDAQQKKIAAVSQEIKASEARQTQEQQSRWTQFAAKEDAAFVERHPDLADPEKASKIASSAMATLEDHGFSKQDLSALWHGQTNVSLRDHRIQSIILDAVKYREAQKAVPAKVSKPVPPVQRPGSSQPKASAEEAKLKNLERNLEKSGDLKDAVAFMMARRTAR